MANDYVKNFVYGNVSVAPSPASSGTSLSLSDADAALFPDPASVGAYDVVVWPAGVKPSASNAEIVRITAKDSPSGGNTAFTITRQQQSTSARTIIIGDQVAMNLTAKTITDIIGMGTSSLVRNEVPSGSVNGSNTAFTTAAAFQTGSLRVYQNGIRLKAGGVDFTEGTQGFTMATAPVTGDILLVDYETNLSSFATGSTSFIYDETPSGTVNGSNTAFILANTPVSGSLIVFRDGQRLVGGGADYTLSGTTITFVTAPATGSVIKCDYQLSLSVAGNADTLDGLHASYFRQGPSGYLINGKIVPSVASNNLTVAIKTLAGNDPSASDPVYVRIGDSIRQITSALSLTKNAGTNWFNAGSSEFATKEIDYFVYLGYNATDGVVIGFARIPYAGEYSDFSTTSTNEKYCAISTITNAASGDDYEVIGRFAATLSAGTGYTWSVPTFTNNNLIQRPIYKTRRLTYSIVFGGYSSNPNIVAKYIVDKSIAKINFGYGGGVGISNANTLTYSLPFTSASGTGYAVTFLGRGYNNSTELNAAQIMITANTAVAAAYPTTEGSTWATSNGKFWQGYVEYPISDL